MWLLWVLIKDLGHIKKRLHDFYVSGKTSEVKQENELGYYLLWVLIRDVGHIKKKTAFSEMLNKKGDIFVKIINPLVLVLEFNLWEVINKKHIYQLYYSTL